MTDSDSDSDSDTDNIFDMCTLSLCNLGNEEEYFEDSFINALKKKDKNTVKSLIESNTEAININMFDVVLKHGTLEILDMIVSGFKDKLKDQIWIKPIEDRDSSKNMPILTTSAGKKYAIDLDKKFQLGLCNEYKDFTGKNISVSQLSDSETLTKVARQYLNSALSHKQEEGGYEYVSAYALSLVAKEPMSSYYKQTAKISYAINSDNLTEDVPIFVNSSEIDLFKKEFFKDKLQQCLYPDILYAKTIHYPNGLHALGILLSQEKDKEGNLFYRASIRDTNDGSLFSQRYDIIFPEQKLDVLTEMMLSDWHVKDKNELQIKTSDKKMTTLNDFIQEKGLQRIDINQHSDKVFQQKGGTCHGVAVILGVVRSLQHNPEAWKKLKVTINFEALSKYLDFSDKWTEFQRRNALSPNVDNYLAASKQPVLDKKVQVDALDALDKFKNIVGVTLGKPLIYKRNAITWNQQFKSLIRRTPSIANMDFLPSLPKDTERKKSFKRSISPGILPSQGEGNMGRSASPPSASLRKPF